MLPINCCALNNCNYTILIHCGSDFYSERD
jgi:hypothetical protein